MQDGAIKHPRFAVPRRVNFRGGQPQSKDRWALIYSAIRQTEWMDRPKDRDEVAAAHARESIRRTPQVARPMDPGDNHLEPPVPMSGQPFLGTTASLRFQAAMQAERQKYDPKVRAVAKQRSRVADERALLRGQKSAAQLKRENEVFAPLAQATQADLSASRSLS
jgi:hypothetical protein